MTHIKTMFSMQSRKAFMAAIIAGTSSASFAQVDGLTVAEVFAVVLATMLAFQATYWTDNQSSELESAALDTYIDVQRNTE